MHAKTTIGPSRVRALPLCVAAEQSVNYFWYYLSFFLLCHIIFSQKGLSQGYEILQRVLSHKKIRFGVRKKFRDHPQAIFPLPVFTRNVRQSCNCTRLCNQLSVELYEYQNFGPSPPGPYSSCSLCSQNMLHNSG